MLPYQTSRSYPFLEKPEVFTVLTLIFTDLDYDCSISDAILLYMGISVELKAIIK